MRDFVTAGAAARRLGVPRLRISDGFSKGWFDDGRCPVMAGRRLIPVAYLPKMAETLGQRSRLARQTLPVDLAAEGREGVTP